MRRTAVVLAALALPVLAGVTTAHAGTPGVRDACGPARPGQVRCFAEIRTGTVRAATGTPAGYGPADLRSAYRLPVGGGDGRTVAIVDAGDDAGAEADLAVYRDHYGLPACTTGNGCFRKVNQAGRASPLPADAGWGVEISLDLDAVSATCPDCHLLLVEADSPGVDDMAAAVDTAVALGATVVSNSYGARENGDAPRLAGSYRHAGVAMVVSSGDDGYGQPNVPAAYDSVVAVGGTTLTRTGDGWHETAWSGAGSGCSAWIAKPSWQHDPNCPGRMVADVAAVADPDTGLAVYDAHDGAGWTVVGGTSAAAPVVAGIIALAGHPDRFATAAHLYGTAGLTDVVGGANGTDRADCGGDYQCTALPGYDGPTGNGTPDGLGAF